ncbi:MAG: ORF6N domain-containing protein [Nitrospira sp.]|nr:ORF6N domain-containing protein [Nitrospira sp.]
MNSLVTGQGIQKRIFLLRGQKVMLSTDPAELYDVEVRALVQAVKRNHDRFPADFMFQLSEAKFADLKSHIVTSSWGGLRRAAPYAFTEQGVAMLSSVLKSRRAVQVNIVVMRTFVQLREWAVTHKEPSAKLKELERKVAGHDEHIQSLFEAIRRLMKPPPTPGRRIGFEVKSVEAGKSKGRHR